MERHEDYFRRLREAEEREREAAKTRDKVPYDPKKLNVERMPLGCWFVIVLAVGILTYLIRKALRVHGL
jgi:hypothetical protein